MKKLTFIAASLLSTNVLAEVDAQVHIDPLTYASINVPYFISTSHNYSIVNDTDRPQAVTVCYTTMLCANVDNSYHKTLHSCEDFVLQPGETRNARKVTKLDFQYPWRGYCNVDATTQIIGWQPLIVGSVGKLKVS